MGYLIQVCSGSFKLLVECWSGGSLPKIDHRLYDNSFELMMSKGHTHASQDFIDSTTCGIPGAAREGCAHGAGRA
jgi:hypothetical protein